MKQMTPRTRIAPGIAARPRLLFSIAALLAFLPITGCMSGDEVGAGRAILVTGASTGIGRKIAERLAHDGFFVYAGARKKEDIDELSAIRNVQGIRLDVTKQEDVDAAVATINDAKRSLYGVINNAGVLTVGSVLDTPWSEFDLVMAVNVAGPYRMTKAFVPLLKATRGRIVNIGSIAGILPGPNLSAYEMSKHALEGFTDSLAPELAGFGIGVSIVEPGDYASDIWKSAMKRTGNEAALKAPPRNLPEPDDVAVAVENALADAKPKRRYLVVPNQKEAEWTIRKQIQQLVELNEDQPYSYDRAALIRMLDESLAKSRRPRD